MTFRKTDMKCLCLLETQKGSRQEELTLTLTCCLQQPRSTCESMSKTPSTLDGLPSNFFSLFALVIKYV